MKPNTAKRMADLERQLTEAKAAQVHNYHFADANVGKAVTEKMMGSGVILTITALGGREIVEPVMILNGLSQETVAALRADFRRAFKYATELKPKGVDELPQQSSPKSQEVEDD